MSDVLFITPNVHGNVRETPVGTLLLATIVRNAGIDADSLVILKNMMLFCPALWI